MKHYRWNGIYAALLVTVARTGPSLAASSSQIPQRNQTAQQSASQNATSRNAAGTASR